MLTLCKSDLLNFENVGYVYKNNGGKKDVVRANL